MTENQPENRQEKQQIPDAMKRLNTQDCGSSIAMIWLLIALTIAPWLMNVLNGGSEDVPIDYSTFRTELEAGNVQRITVSGQEITGQLQEASVTELKAGEPVTYTQFITYLPSFGDDTLLSLLEAPMWILNPNQRQDFRG